MHGLGSWIGRYLFDLLWLTLLLFGLESIRLAAVYLHSRKPWRRHSTAVVKEPR